MTLREAIFRRGSRLPDLVDPPESRAIAGPSPALTVTGAGERLDVLDDASITAEAGGGVTVTDGGGLTVAGGSITGAPWKSKPAWYPIGAIAASLNETAPWQRLAGPGVLIQDGSATITGGTIDGSGLSTHSGIGLLAFGGSSVEISGGLITGHWALQYSGSGAIEITGGVFRSRRTLVRAVGARCPLSRAYARAIELGSYAVGLELAAGGTAAIRGGELRGAVGSLIARIAGGAKLTVSGGTLGGTCRLRIDADGMVVFSGKSLSIDRRGGFQILTGALSDGSAIKANLVIEAGRLVHSNATSVVFAGDGSGSRLPLSGTPPILTPFFPGAPIPQRQSRSQFAL